MSTLNKTEEMKNLSTNSTINIMHTLNKYIDDDELRESINLFIEDWK